MKKMKKIKIEKKRKTSMPVRLIFLFSLMHVTPEIVYKSRRNHILFSSKRLNRCVLFSHIIENKKQKKHGTTLLLYVAMLLQPCSLAFKINK